MKASGGNKPLTLWASSWSFLTLSLQAFYQRFRELPELEPYFASGALTYRDAVTCCHEQC